MSGDEWTTLAVLVAMLGVLVVDRFPPAGVVFGATFALLLTDVIDADVAFSGFSNSAPLTVAALYVLARGAQKTGLLTAMTSRLLGDGTGRPALARFLVPTAGASAFFPNTPLHDAAVIIRNNRILAASVVLPLTDNISATSNLGTNLD